MEDNEGDLEMKARSEREMSEGSKGEDFAARGASKPKRRVIPGCESRL